LATAALCHLSSTSSTTGQNYAIDDERRITGRKMPQGALGMNTAADKFSGFHDVVTSIDEVQAIIGEPMPQVLTKVTDKLDDLCRAFIAKSSFCVIATSNPDGHIDVSPKGDPAGFVEVLDDKHLAIPDRPGNRRVDTFHNLIENPQLAIIFIIPGKGETLRIGGEARIVRDQDLRDTMAINGKVPDFAIVVHVERIFMHCPKCMIRSKIWQPDAWPDSSDIMEIGDAMIKHGHLSISPENLLAEAEKAGALKLY
jgi:hypothetical protein